MSVLFHVSMLSEDVQAQSPQEPRQGTSGAPNVRMRRHRFWRPAAPWASSSSTTPHSSTSTREPAKLLEPGSVVHVRARRTRTFEEELPVARDGQDASPWWDRRVTMEVHHE
jgi:hypothetical protein